MYCYVIHCLLSGAMSGGSADGATGPVAAEGQNRVIDVKQFSLQDYKRMKEKEAESFKDSLRQEYMNKFLNILMSKPHNYSGLVSSKRFCHGFARS